MVNEGCGFVNGGGVVLESPYQQKADHLGCLLKHITQQELYPRSQAIMEQAWEWD